MLSAAGADRKRKSGKRSGLDAIEQREPELVLEVTMVMNMFVAVVMMYSGSEGRACKHHNKQSGENQLFHSQNRNMRLARAKGACTFRVTPHESKVELLPAQNRKRSGCGALLQPWPRKLEAR